MVFTPNYYNRRGLKSQEEYLRRKQAAEARRLNASLYSSGTTGHSFLQPPSYPTLPTPQHTPFCPFIPPPPSPTYSNSSFYLPPSPAYHPSNHHFMFAPPSTPFPPFSPGPQHHPAALVSFGAGRNLDASYMQPSPFHVLEELKPVPGKFIFFVHFLIVSSRRGNIINFSIFSVESRPEDDHQLMAPQYTHINEQEAHGFYSE